MREVATKTNDIAGGGTPPPPCWPRPSCARVLRNVAAGANPMASSAALEAVDAAVEELKTQAREISGKEDIAAWRISPMTGDR